MDEFVDVQEIDVQDFMKPRCPVKIGDRFYKRCKVPNKLNYAVVTNIESKEDEEGPYFVITAEWVNIAIGIRVKKYSSRNFESDFVIF